MRFDQPFHCVFYGPFTTRFFLSMVHMKSCHNSRMRLYKAPRRASTLSRFLWCRSTAILSFSSRLNPLPPGSLPYESRREAADEQMRRRFRNLRQILTIPILHGISTFGTQLSFYEYDSASQVLHPSSPTLTFLATWP